MKGNTQEKEKPVAPLVAAINESFAQNPKYLRQQEKKKQKQQKKQNKKEPPPQQPKQARSDEPTGKKGDGKQSNK